jgi:glycosyltransferase involved in cell wall biosynthesis
MSDGRLPRVTIITNTLRRQGGTEIYVAAAIRALQAAGHPLRVLVDYVFPGSTRLPDFASLAGVPLTDTLSPRRLLARRRDVRRLADRLVEGSDVVAFHGLAPVDLIRALSGRVATVLAVHTTWLTCPSGRYLPASRTTCPRRPGLGCLISDRREVCLVDPDRRRFRLVGRVRATLRGRQSALLSRWVTGILFNSAALRADFRSHVEDPRHAWVVHPPLVTAEVHPEVRRADRIAFLGRLIRLKGADDAIDCLARVDRDDVQLEVFGDGPELARLQRWAERLGVGTRVIFHGWSDEETVARGLARASCLLVPTRGFEAFGQIGPQAIHAGCPAVAYDSGGIREWCRPPHGIVVPLGDVGAMTRGIQEWLRFFREGGDSSTWRQEATARWGEERFAREYLRVIEDARRRFLAERTGHSAGM